MVKLFLFFERFSLSLFPSEMIFGFFFFFSVWTERDAATTDLMHRLATQHSERKLSKV